MAESERDQTIETLDVIVTANTKQVEEVVPKVTAELITSAKLIVENFNTATNSITNLGVALSKLPNPSQMVKRSREATLHNAKPGVSVIGLEEQPGGSPFYNPKTKRNEYEGKEVTGSVDEQLKQAEAEQRRVKKELKKQIEENTNILKLEVENAKRIKAKLEEQKANEQKALDDIASKEKEQKELINLREKAANITAKEQNKYKEFSSPQVTGPVSFFKHIFAPQQPTGVSAEGANRSIIEAQLKAKTSTEEIKKMLIAGDGWGTQMANIAKRALVTVPIWMALRSAIQMVQGSFNAAISAAIQWEAQMARIKVVGNATEGEYDILSKRLLSLGTAYGTSIKDLGEGATLWTQQGKAISEIAPLMETTIRLSMLTGKSVADSVEDITSIMKSYNIVANETISIVDKLAKVDMEHAITTDVLTDALKRVAPIATQYGVTFEKLLGIITATHVATRASGEQIGTAWRSIFVRMSNSAIGAIQSIAKVPMYLKETGEASFEPTTKLRNFGDVLDEISLAYVTLEPTQKTALNAALAQTRQTNYLASAFQNWEEGIRASLESLVSFGMGERAVNILIGTTESKVKQLNSAWAEFGNTIMENGNGIKVAIDWLKNLVVGMSDVIATGKALATMNWAEYNIGKTSNIQTDSNTQEIKYHQQNITKLKEIENVSKELNNISRLRSYYESSEIVGKEKQLEILDKRREFINSLLSTSGIDIPVTAKIDSEILDNVKKELSSLSGKVPINIENTSDWQKRIKEELIIKEPVSVQIEPNIEETKEVHLKGTYDTETIKGIEVPVTIKDSQYNEIKEKINELDQSVIIEGKVDPKLLTETENLIKKIKDETVKDSLNINIPITVDTEPFDAMLEYINKIKNNSTIDIKLSTDNKSNVDIINNLKKSLTIIAPITVDDKQIKDLDKKIITKKQIYISIDLDSQKVEEINKTLLNLETSFNVNGKINIEDLDNAKTLINNLKEDISNKSAILNIDADMTVFNTVDKKLNELQNQLTKKLDIKGKVSVDSSEIQLKVPKTILASLKVDSVEYDKFKQELDTDREVKVNINIDEKIIKELNTSLNNIKTNFKITGQIDKKELENYKKSILNLKDDISKTSITLNIPTDTSSIDTAITKLNKLEEKDYTVYIPVKADDINKLKLELDSINKDIKVGISVDKEVDNLNNINKDIKVAVFIDDKKIDKLNSINKDIKVGVLVDDKEIDKLNKKSPKIVASLDLDDKQIEDLNKKIEAVNIRYKVSGEVSPLEMEDAKKAISEFSKYVSNKSFSVGFEFDTSSIERANKALDDMQKNADKRKEQTEALKDSLLYEEASIRKVEEIQKAQDKINTVASQYNTFARKAGWYNSIGDISNKTSEQLLAEQNKFKDMSKQNIYSSPEDQKVLNEGIKSLEVIIRETQRLEGIRKGGTDKFKEQIKNERAANELAEKRTATTEEEFKDKLNLINLSKELGFSELEVNKQEAEYLKSRENDKLKEYDDLVHKNEKEKEILELKKARKDMIDEETLTLTVQERYGKSAIQLEELRLAVIRERIAKGQEGAQSEIDQIKKITLMKEQELNAYAATFKGYLQDSFKGVMSGEQDFSATMKKGMIESYRNEMSGGMANLVMGTGVGDIFAGSMSKLKEAFGIIGNKMEDKLDLSNQYLNAIVQNTASLAGVSGATPSASGVSSGTASPGGLLGLGASKLSNMITGAGNWRTGSGSTGIEVYKKTNAPGETGWRVADAAEALKAKRSAALAPVVVGGVQGVLTGYSAYQSAKAGGSSSAGAAMQGVGATGMAVGGALAMGFSGGAAGAGAGTGLLGIGTANSWNFVGWIILIVAALMMIGSMFMKQKKSEQTSTQTQTSEQKVSSKIDITNKQLEIVNRNLVALKNTITTYILPSSVYFSEKYGLDEQFAVNSRRGLL